MSEKETWEHRSLEWLHEARRRHAEEQKDPSTLSPEALAVAERLGLRPARPWPPAESREAD